MFDHIGLGVTDLAASKAFFLKALQPLGVAVAMEGPYGSEWGKTRSHRFGYPKRRSTPSVCTWPLPLKPESKSMSSIARHWLPEERTMGLLDFARITTRTTMAHLSLAPTGTTSKPFPSARRLTLRVKRTLLTSTTLPSLGRTPE